MYFVNRPELRPLQVSFREGGYATFGAGKLFHHPAGYVDRRGWDGFYLRNEAAKREGWPLDSWGEDTPFPEPFPNSVYNRGRAPKSFAPPGMPKSELRLVTDGDAFHLERKKRRER